MDRRNFLKSAGTVAAGCLGLGATKGLTRSRRDKIKRFDDEANLKLTKLQQEIFGELREKHGRYGKSPVQTVLQDMKRANRIRMDQMAQVWVDLSTKGTGALKTSFDEKTGRLVFERINPRDIPA